MGNRGQVSFRLRPNGLFEMSSFWARQVSDFADVVTIEIGFGAPAQNDEIVPDAVAAVMALPLRAGVGLHINGPITVPAAMAIAHSVGHRFPYIACYDPKIDAYVVVIAHGPDHRPGQLLRTPS